jgi:putative hydrolase of the HAD superfamily
MIRAVLFDFYDTLGYLDSERVLAGRREIARRAGADEERFFDVWRTTFQARSLGRLGPLEDELAHTFRLLGLDVPPSLVAELADFERATWCSAVQLYPDALPVLAALRERGLKLGLVSNCSAQAAGAIRALGLAERLDVLVASCEVNLLKPDPAIYRRAYEPLGVEPTDCAFVGDGGSRELEAAHGLGMLTLWIQRPGEPDGLAAGQPYDRRIERLDQLLDLVPPRASGA